MKNYDDLQRFKEKTQTLGIAFKDMSGQLQEPAENSQWALIRQLANDDASTPFSGSQRIDLPQPQPLRGDEFRAPPVQAFSLPAPARRFGGLFRPRHSEPVSLPKETLLKPLLEKIALCR